jgi:putative membrane protein
MMFFGFFWFLILIVIIVWLIYWAQSGQRGMDIFRGPSGHREDPLEILRVRYAKGEISKEQFEQMRKDLLS